MNPILIMAGIIAVVAVVTTVFALNHYRKEQKLRHQYPGFPKGYWMSQGMGIGVALGAGIGVALGNLAIGIGVGIAIGAGIGSANEKKHAHETRPTTPEELALRRQAMRFMLGIFLAGLVVLLLLFLFLRE